MTCGICCATIWPWQEYNWDHTIPMSLGGPRGKRNKQRAHSICNFVKGSQYPFSLASDTDRENYRSRVTVDTFERLSRIWAGEPDFPAAVVGPCDDEKLWTC